MAYLRSLDEQKQQQLAQQQSQQGQGQQFQNQRPNFAASGQTITPDPGTMAAPAHSAPTQGKSGDNGTGSGSWVNIDSYLNANPSLGKVATDKATSLLGTEQQNYNKASDAIRNATKNFKLQRIIPDSIHTSLQMGDLDSIKKAYNQSDYGGPSTFDYDTSSGNKNITDIKKLSNRDTATDVLAADAIKQGNYGGGMRTLDSSLLGADQNYKEASPQIWTNINDFINKTNEDKSGLEGLAAWDKSAVAAQKSGIRNELDKERRDYQNSIDEKLKSYKDQAGWTKKGYADSYADWYNNNYKKKTDANAAAIQANKDPSQFSQSDLFKYGNLSNFQDPTVQNVGTNEEYKVLSGIGDILGDGNPLYQRGSGGSYKVPELTIDNGQGAIDSWRNGPGINYNTGSGASVNFGNDWIANQILGAGNIETPEQLYKRLGIS